VIANEALPDSAETGIEHVRPVVVGLHRVDVDEMFEKVALPPLIAIPTDTADAETNWVRRLVDVVARLGMVSSAWPLVSTAAGWLGAVELPPPPPPQAAVAAAIPNNATAKPQ
jgi:hypothetical protein